MADMGWFIHSLTSFLRFTHTSFKKATALVLERKVVSRRRIDYKLSPVLKFTATKENSPVDTRYFCVLSCAVVKVTVGVSTKLSKEEERALVSFGTFPLLIATSSKRFCLQRNKK